MTLAVDFTVGLGEYKISESNGTMAFVIHERSAVRLKLSQKVGLFLRTVSNINRMLCKIIVCRVLTNVGVVLINEKIIKELLNKLHCFIPE